MWPRRNQEPTPFVQRSERPEGEIPPGFRLRRVGPAEWIAEPTRWYLWAGFLAIVGFCIGGVVGAFAARAYYHNTATVTLLTINGVPFRQDDLRNRLEHRYGIDEVLRFAVTELSRQFAEARHCWPSDEEVDARMQRERQRPDFAERLALAGIREDDYREELRLDMAQTNLLIRGITVTPDEVQEFYRRNANPNNPAARYYSPARVQVTVVGTSTEAAARQALRELGQGVSWRVVVTRYSEHDSRRTGGLMPPFAKGESIFATNPAAEAAIFAMQPGDRIGPIAAARQWWIVRCDSQWREATVPWSDAKEDARIGAMLAKGIVRNGPKLEAERAEFVKRSTIIVSDPAYGEAQEAVLSRPVRW